MRIQLSLNSYVEHLQGFIDATSASALLTRLHSEFEFEQHSVRLFGKTVAQPRLIAWCGTRPYTYSGLTLPPKDMPSCLLDVLQQVSRATQAPFNHLLLNLYRNGVDSMGYHADNEPELGLDPVVATLSLGATRRFHVKARRGNQAATIELGNGDLVVMGGHCQREFVHGIPKQPRITDCRLSVTFRFVSSPET